MKIIKVLLLVLVVSPAPSWAGLISFNAKGVAGVSGFVQFNDTDFDATSSQILTNTFITDLSLNVFGELFSLADVIASDSTFIDSTGPSPSILIIKQGEIGGQ